jgi:hypothetical protein
MYYLSGKISDSTREKELANIKVFDDTEVELVKRGINVFNPTRLEEEGRSWEWYLAKDLRWIYENRPTIYLLDGWEESRGARLEVEFARLLGLYVLYPL